MIGTTKDAYDEEHEVPATLSNFEHWAMALEMVHILINVGLETIFAEGTSASMHLLVMFVLMCLCIPAYTYVLLKILGVGCVNPIRTIKVILRANKNAPFSHEMFKRATMLPPPRHQQEEDSRPQQSHASRNSVDVVDRNHTRWKMAGKLATKKVKKSSFEHLVQAAQLASSSDAHHLDLMRQNTCAFSGEDLDLMRQTSTAFPGESYESTASADSVHTFDRQKRKAGRWKKAGHAVRVANAMSNKMSKNSHASTNSRDSDSHASTDTRDRDSHASTDTRDSAGRWKKAGHTVRFANTMSNTGSKDSHASADTRDRDAKTQRYVSAFKDAAHIWRATQRLASDAAQDTDTMGNRELMRQTSTALPGGSYEGAASADSAGRWKKAGHAVQFADTMSNKGSQRHASGSDQGHASRNTQDTGGMTQSLSRWRKAGNAVRFATRLKNSGPQQSDDDYDGIAPPTQMSSLSDPVHFPSGENHRWMSADTGRFSGHALASPGMWDAPQVDHPVPSLSPRLAPMIRTAPRTGTPVDPYSTQSSRPKKVKIRDYIGIGESAADTHTALFAANPPNLAGLQHVSNLTAQSSMVPTKNQSQV